MPAFQPYKNRRSKRLVLKKGASLVVNLERIPKRLPDGNEGQSKYCPQARQLRGSRQGLLHNIGGGWNGVAFVQIGPNDQLILEKWVEELRDH